jgi:hypothetical protein
MLLGAVVLLHGKERAMALPFWDDRLATNPKANTHRPLSKLAD